MTFNSPILSNIVNVLLKGPHLPPIPMPIQANFNPTLTQLQPNFMTNFELLKGHFILKVLAVKVLTAKASAIKAFDSS